MVKQEKSEKIEKSSRPHKHSQETDVNRSWITCFKCQKGDFIKVLPNVFSSGVHISLGRFMEYVKESINSLPNNFNFSILILQVEIENIEIPVGYQSNQYHRNMFFLKKMRNENPGISIKCFSVDVVTKTGEHSAKLPGKVTFFGYPTDVNDNFNKVEVISAIEKSIKHLTFISSRANLYIKFIKANGLTSSNIRISECSKSAIFASDYYLISANGPRIPIATGYGLRVASGVSVFKNHHNNPGLLSIDSSKSEIPVLSGRSGFPIPHAGGCSGFPIPCAVSGFPVPYFRAGFPIPRVESGFSVSHFSAGPIPPVGSGFPVPYTGFGSSVHHAGSGFRAVFGDIVIATESPDLPIDPCRTGLLPGGRVGLMHVPNAGGGIGIADVNQPKTDSDSIIALAVSGLLKLKAS
jgi:hypothetical protein